ncbi:MAG: hypothetical protein ACPF80_03955 [Flavobacteriaceae bacterium]
MNTAPKNGSIFLVVKEAEIKLDGFKFCQDGELATFHFATNEEQIWKVLKQFSVRYLVWIQEAQNKEAQIRLIHKHYTELNWIVICKQKSIRLIYKWQSWVSPKAIWWIGDILHLDFYYFFSNQPLGCCHLSPSLQNLFKKPFLQISKFELELLKEIYLGKSHQQLCDLLPWSSSSIHRHKSRLKELFGIPLENDCKLVYTAQSMGYLDSV